MNLAGLQIRALLFSALTVFTMALPAAADPLPLQIEVRDQCATPTCWLHATTSAIDYYGQAKYGQFGKFNIDYLFMHEMRGRALGRFLGHEGPLMSGGRMMRALALALEHGLIPESVWEPQKSLVENAAETVAQIEALLKSGIRSQPEFMRRLDRIFTDLMGPIPRNFQFAGRTWTPRELSNDLLAGSRAQQLQYRQVEWERPASRNSDDTLWKTIISQTGTLIPIEEATASISYVALNDATALEQMAEALSNEQRPVLVSFATRNPGWERTFLETPEAAPFYTSSMPRQQVYGNSHLVVAIGADVNAQGGIDLTVQNSHGTQDGVNGIRTLLNEFFLNHGLAAHEFVPPWFNCAEIFAKKG